MHGNNNTRIMDTVIDSLILLFEQQQKQQNI